MSSKVEIEEAKNKETPTKPEKIKKSCPLAVAIILAVLALGGIGFGIFGMMNKKPETNTQNCDCPKCEKSDCKSECLKCETSKNEEEKDDSNIDPKDYIYIGEWGIKIKMPENAKEKVASYSFSRGWPQAMDGYTITEVSENPGSIYLSDGTGFECDYWAHTPEACLDVDDVRILIGVSDTVSEEFKNHFLDRSNYSKIK